MWTLYAPICEQDAVCSYKNHGAYFDNSKANTKGLMIIKSQERLLKLYGHLFKALGFYEVKTLLLSGLGPCACGSKQ